MPGQDTLDHFFLGPKSELRTLLKELLELAVDDYTFWRRNYHPKDPPAMLHSALDSRAALHYRSQLQQELFELVADLKLDVPFFSPRYMAHMVSEVALPGLVAYLATMLYNPNNVSLEASPVTVRYELEVGRQFAALFGFDPDHSFGHLCSGGTVANYESLWYEKAGRFLPLAMVMAAHDAGMARPAGLPTTVWGLLNVSLDQTAAAFASFVRDASGHGLDGHQLLRQHGIAEAGDLEYRRRVEQHFGESYSPPVVILPETAHYCWRRAAGLLGLGRRQLLPVQVDSAFRMDPVAYRQTLDRCRRDRVPVLQSVFVLGTTEFGSVDPLPELLAVRDELRQLGLDSPVHVDAAYGGYLAAIFRRRDGATASPPAEEEPWLERLRGNCQALRSTDSVSVDPHKLGYAPYGAGGIVLRHGFLPQLVTEGASYIFDGQAGAHDDLGKYILEGSKPGAAAAAVWFNHRMMPLNERGYGALLQGLCRLAQTFHGRIETACRWLAAAGKNFTLLSLGAPETNIVGLLVVPTAATRLSAVDGLNRRLALRFGVREVSSVQAYDYLVSKTRLEVTMPFVRQQPLLAGLDQDVAHLTSLRLVFMNRWVRGVNLEGQSYMDDFLAKLIAAAESELGAAALLPATAGECPRP